MKNKSNKYAVLAGVFLLLYSLPNLLIHTEGLLSGYPLEISELPQLGYIVTLPLAALFLILRKPRYVAVCMTISAVLAMLIYLPDIPRYLHDVPDYLSPDIPPLYALLPVLYALEMILFALALYLRGKGALLVALLVAVTDLAAAKLQFAAFAYVTGHPSPLNLLLPFNFILAAIFTGLYLLSPEKHASPRGDISE